MSDAVTPETMPQRAVVQFDCHGQAVGKMRNELVVCMVKPFEERFELATDEGPFHGGDSSAPPPLALFVGGLTGCIMTQIRAFAKRLRVPLNDLSVDVRVQWDWAAKDRVYETAPKSFEIDIALDSDAPMADQHALIDAAKKGCFIEQTLGQSNTIRHRIRQGEDWIEVD
ncbi:OsmC family protein [Shimia aestuarii]|uniref:Uncharacterized OsmC-related protein n=1 Tax=Shimia aestuarii TaxID=254406 RepID=A0A1I4Q9X6_9RHOB|nr:OsmC family protein [Shimia aestuarii]SFM36400.1 Uncharacterized OsmC-related protein [Shimia aestuarii]